MTSRGRTAAVLVSALLLAGCAPGPGPAVGTAVDEAAGGTFALSEVEGIDGSAFLVVCPYETEGSVKERLGADWTPSDRADDEGAQTLAVLDDGEVEAIGIERDSADFCGSGPWELLPLDTRLAVSESRAVAVAE